jgi:hypothetical protein
MGWFIEMPLHFSCYLDKMDDEFWYDISSLDTYSPVFIPNPNEFVRSEIKHKRRESNVVNGMFRAYYHLTEQKRSSLTEDFVLGKLRVYLNHTDTLRDLIDDGMDVLDTLYNIHSKLAKHRYTTNDSSRTLMTEPSYNNNHREFVIS